MAKDAITPRPLLDYKYCSYGGSRLRFRGPACDVDQPYIAVLGGTETFGKYVGSPYPELLSELLGVPVMNLGIAHAGLSLFSEEQWLLDAASQSSLTVFQVLGAQNMSNRLYSVHTRRNDRFLAVSPALREIFPEVDFSQINFTGHLLATLRAQSLPAFEVVVDELKWAWVQRMRRLVRTIRGETVLLWMSDRGPGDPSRCHDGVEPLFVDRDMLDGLRSDVAGIVEVTADAQAACLEGKCFEPSEAQAARAVPGPRQHARVAEELAEMISGEMAAGLQSSQARSKDQSFSISSGTAENRSATRP